MWSLFRTVSENSTHIYPKLLPRMSSFLRAIEFFFYLMHFCIKIYMVCSYSFELSQKTVPTTFILNYRLICLLRAIEKIVFLINAFLHQNIYGM